MNQRVPLTHTLGVPPVDDLGVTGTTLPSPQTPSPPSLFHQQCLPSSIPCRFRPRPGFRSSLHGIHNAYHYDHLILSKKMALPRAFRHCPSVTSKERV